MSEESELLEDFETLSEDLRSGVRELGWSSPMPVQARVIPRMRAGRDLIVQAVTGSGKTGAFGLPILEHIDPELKAIQGLVLAPTRELAGQVSKEIAAMGKFAGIESLTIYGGVAYGPQLDGFDRGVQVVVGTPGRILDHLNSGKMKLDRLRVLIFDEADELLSLGFWPDMREIQRFIPRERQTGLFSATMPERVRSLARTFLNDPEFISLTEGGVRSPEEIEHCHYIVEAQHKEKALLRIVEHEEPESAIIFCNTRADVRYLTAYLQRNDLDADMIQGEMTQGAREKVMQRIKAGELRFLIATDVAARGIDISDLSHVISYSASDSPEVYLHRTGRTGRAGKTGTAISLVSGLDIGNFRTMQKVNRMVIPERELPSQEVLAARIALRVKNRIEHDLREMPERERQRRMERLLPVVEELAGTDEGRRDLAAVLFGYVFSQPAPPEYVPPTGSSDSSGPSESSEPDDAPGERRDDDRPDAARPRRRRRRRRAGTH